MDIDSFQIFDLERHDTRDVDDQHVNGNLTVIWRDWDDHHLKSPKMVYLTSVGPNEKKGPHLHTQRNSFFSCIKGKVHFIIKDKTEIYAICPCCTDKIIQECNNCKGNGNCKNNTCTMKDCKILEHNK